MNVIINADDLGYSLDINRSIEHYITLGAISSSTILANGKAFKDVPAIVKRHPNISFGIHLNLSEFESLTKSPVFFKYGMTDVDGVFIKGALRSARFTKELKEAIYKEWVAQVSKIQDVGITISHIDGHHHCHTQVELFDVLKKLARDFKIKKIRQNSVCRLFYMRRKKLFKSNNSNTTGNFNKTALKYSFMQLVFYYLKIVIWYFRIKFYFVTTDLFLAYEDFVFGYDFIKKKNQIVIELMCHPGHPNFEVESELLLSNTLKHEPKFTLVSYGS